MELVMDGGRVIYIKLDGVSMKLTQKRSSKRRKF